MKRLMVALLCLAFLVFAGSVPVLGGGDQNQNQNENREQGEKDNPNDNGERKRECSRLCIDCGAPIDLDCPLCPECGSPQPD